MIRKFLVILTLAGLAACSGGSDDAKAAGGAGSNGSAEAIDVAGCERFFLGGKPPALINRAYEQKTQQICYRAFAVLHSGLSRTPLWSAQSLTAPAIEMARRTPRVENFHPEPSLPAEDRAELADYVRSGYDRGHLAPSADMPSAAADGESFSLANIVPQAASLNRGSWADLEETVRRHTRSGTVYVVSGPLFQGRAARIGRTRRVLLPSHVWKAIYVDRLGATVFVATNVARPVWASMTVDQFTAFSGIDPFPGLEPTLRNVNAAYERIPDPNRGDGDGKGKAGENGRSGDNEECGLHPVTGQYTCGETLQRVRAQYPNGRYARPQQ